MPGRIKRIAAPQRWPVKRKTDFWAPKPSPGPHPLGLSLPLLTVIRDVLSLCDTGKEARLMVSSGNFFIDGRVVKDPNFPVGLMDVLSAPLDDLNFRMLMDRRNRMHLVPISREEAAWKICRVQGKTVVGRGRTQVHLHDGRNLFNVDARTGDAVRLELPTQKVLDVFRLQKGSKAFIAGGSHVGEIATVERFERWDNPAPNLVYFQEGFSTVWNNVFVFGDQPLIRVPEVGLQ